MQGHLQARYMAGHSAGFKNHQYYVAIRHQSLDFTKKQTLTRKRSIEPCKFPCHAAEESGHSGQDDSRQQWQQGCQGDRSLQSLQPPTRCLLQIHHHQGCSMCDSCQ